MPEIPDVTPYVPTAPDMPDLPPEIPWPPDVDWPEIPPWVPPSWPPWELPDDGPPRCFIEFADRLMALMEATALHRAYYGQVPGWPPFNLRTMAAFATPQIVSMAALWFTTMWNTHFDGDPVEYGESQVVTPEYSHDDGYISVSGDYFAIEESLSLSMDNGLAVAFRGLSTAPAGTRIAAAALRFQANAASIGSGDLSCRIMGTTLSSTFPAPNGGGHAGAISDYYARRAACIGTYVEHDFGPLSISQTVTIDITTLIQALIDSGSWTYGCTIVIDPFDSDTAGRNLTFDSFDVGTSPPRLTVTMPQMVPVTAIPSLLLGEFNCAVMLAWLTAVEAVCWPHLRA